MFLCKWEKKSRKKVWGAVGFYALGAKKNNQKFFKVLTVL
jgi:hypothetical protein